MNLKCAERPLRRSFRIAAGCAALTAAAELRAGSLQFEYTMQLSIDAGDVAPTTLVFGVHDDADDNYSNNDDGTLDAYEDEYYTPPTQPPPGTPSNLAELVFLATSPGIGLTELERDMRATPVADPQGQETVTWDLDLDLSSVQGSTVTLTRTALTDSGFLTGRSLRLLSTDQTTPVDVDLLQNLGGVLTVDLNEGGAYLIVNALTGQNQSPVAVADTRTLLKNSAATDISVKTNDTDPDGDPLTITGVRPTDQAAFASPTAATAQGGTATIAGDVVQYTPAVDFVGTDTFEYRIDDGNTGTDTAVVTVKVQEIVAARTHSGTVQLGTVLTVQVELNFDPLNLDTMRVVEIMPFTEETPPNSWQYVSGSVQLSSRALPVVTQDENELEFDFGTDIPASSPATLTYDVFVAAPGVQQKQFQGKVYYKTTGAVDEANVTVPATAIAPQLPGQPYRTYAVEDAFSFVAVPFTGTGVANAEELLAKILHSSFLWYWNPVTQSWSGHRKGSALNNFSIDPGYPYLVLVDAPSVVLLDGTAWADPAINLEAGFDLICLSQPRLSGLADTKVETLAQDISAVPNVTCRFIWVWDAPTQSWSGHRLGSALNNFDVEAGETYLLLIEGSGTW